MLIISSFWSSSQQWSQPEGEPITRSFKLPTTQLQSPCNLFAPTATVNNAIDHMTHFRSAHSHKHMSPERIKKVLLFKIAAKGSSRWQRDSSRTVLLTGNPPCGGKRKGGNLQPTLRSRPRTLPSIPAWSNTEYGGYYTHQVSFWDTCRRPLILLTKLYLYNEVTFTTRLVVAKYW